MFAPIKWQSGGREEGDWLPQREKERAHLLPPKRSPIWRDLDSCKRDRPRPRPDYAKVLVFRAHAMCIVVAVGVKVIFHAVVS